MGFWLEINQKETGRTFLETLQEQKQEKSESYPENLTEPEIIIVIQKKISNKRRDDHVEPKNCKNWLQRDRPTSEHIGHEEK